MTVKSQHVPQQIPQLTGQPPVTKVTTVGESLRPTIVAGFRYLRLEGICSKSLTDIVEPCIWVSRPRYLCFWVSDPGTSAFGLGLDLSQTVPELGGTSAELDA